MSSRCFGSEPEFAPIRIGIPFALAALTTSATLSEPPMFPGLMRTAATPCSIAFKARLALKWMSAMIGTGEKRTILPSASASSVFGTATRTISQPALTSSAIWAVVAGTSCVFVVVIDWTTTGAPPPIATLPTEICRLLATASTLARAVAPEIVREGDEEDQDYQREADDRDPLVDLTRDRASPDRLEDGEQNV